MVVHFPIALLLVGLLVDGWGLIVRRASWLPKAALLLYVLGTGALIAAYFSGKQAAGALTWTDTTRVALDEHASWAEWTLWFFLILTVIRGAFRDNSSRVVTLILWLFMLPGVYLIWETGSHGAALVYRLGVPLQHIRTEQLEIQALPAAPEEDCEEETPQQAPSSEDIGCQGDLGELGNLR